MSLSLDQQGNGGATRIKVLVVCGSLGVGGAEVQVCRLLPRLNREIFDVQVAYYVPETGFPKQVLVDEGVKVTCLSGAQWNRRRYLASAIQFMRKEKFDLVHAFQDADNHYGRIPAILAGVPVVVGGLQGKRGLHGRWPYLYSLMNVRCAGWIVNSRELKEWAARKMFFMEHSPTRIVRNGLHLDNESSFRRQEHTCYDELKSEKPVVGIVGRLHPVKNHLLFVEMARKLTDSGVDADYWIIGEGEMRGQIEREIERFGLGDRVKLLGFRKDVDAALSRIDVGVLTSYSEGCPNALLEAMRASLPVVSTNCTSLEEVVEEGDNGFTVGIGDAEALKDKVAHILSDKQMAQEMGARSRQIIEERFGISSAVNDLEEAYLYYINNSRRDVARLQNMVNQLVANQQG